jgi:hypothetical protein
MSSWSILHDSMVLIFFWGKHIALYCSPLILGFWRKAGRSVSSSDLDSPVRFQLDLDRTPAQTYRIEFAVSYNHAMHSVACLNFHFLAAWTEPVKR